MLLPTERCNFRCVYCYETFKNGRMERPVIQGVRRLLTKRAPTLRRLSVEWFGGEPLLERGIVREIQGHIRDLEAEHESLYTDASITTNGYYLSRKVLEDLVRLGVSSYQISLDGGPEAHNGRRPRADGAGTFQRIWQNLLAARDSKSDFEFCLRIHVDRENVGPMQSFLGRLAGTFGGDRRYKVLIRHVSRLGGANDGLLPVLGLERTDVIGELRLRAEELGLTLADSKPLPCYAAAANSFVIRSTGEIAKCTVAFEHPANRVGRLHPDGTATIDNQKMKGWVRGIFSKDPEELQCPLKGLAEPGPAPSLLTVLPS